MQTVGRGDNTGSAYLRKYGLVDLRCDRARCGHVGVIVAIPLVVHLAVMIGCIVGCPCAPIASSHSMGDIICGLSIVRGDGGCRIETCIEESIPIEVTQPANSI